MNSVEIHYATYCGSTIEEPSSGSKIQGENYLYGTAYLIFVLFALRPQHAYIYIYDESKIFGYNINVYKNN